MILNGKLFDIKDTQQVSDTFKKRTFVVEYTENLQYPEYITFELVQDRCALLDGLQVGQEIAVSFNLKGRKWINPEGETRYFNSLQAWRIEATAKTVSQPNEESKQAQEAADTIEEDDLPF